MYNQENLCELKNKRNIALVALSISFLIFIASFIFLYIFSQRDNKLTMKVLGGILLFLLLSLFIFSLSYSIYMTKFINQFSQIMLEKGEEIDSIFITRKDYKVTLQDHYAYYELTFNVNGEERIYYLSSLFDDIFETNKKYKLIVVSGFIKEIIYE